MAAVKKNNSLVECELPLPTEIVNLRKCMYEMEGAVSG
jgi:hypothetical protein